jgi:chemotaxis protein CheZ
MMGMQKEDWNELLHILKETEESATALNGADSGKEILRSRQSLESFQKTAATHGLADLEKAGVELERYLSSQIEPTGSVDAIAAFGFAVSSLIDQLQDAKGKGAGTAIDVGEVLEILGLSDDDPVEVLNEDEMPSQGMDEHADSQQETLPENASKESEATVPFSRLEEILRNLGGDLSFTPNGKPGGKFSLTFTGPSETLEKLENLLCAGDSQSSQPIVPDRYDKILKKGQEFMTAFSNGDIIGAQEILMSLADPKTQVGLYKEIGGLARGLHDSIRSFLSTMDPSLKEMVEDRIPDTGNRLEHMLELTEKAANTTLDHVEAIQSRLGDEQKQLGELRELIGGLRAIGDQAGKKLEKGGELLGGLGTMINQNREDLDAILTAQDYQDLSGQIIQKIMKLLKDMELKLVNVIRTFGVKIETGKKADNDELYGPAHQAREESVHSQDEVDSLLAEFGF